MEYYIERNGQTVGPYAKGDIKTMLDSGVLTMSSLIWSQDYTDWKKVSETEFAVSSRPPVFSSPPPQNIETPKLKQKLKFNLLPDEKVLFSTKNKFITVTDFRVYAEKRTWFSAYSSLIFLEDIGSVEFGLKRELWLFILGIITIPLYGVGILVLIVWWFWSKKKIVILSNSGVGFFVLIDFLQGSTMEEITDIIQRAKLERNHFLHSK